MRKLALHLIAALAGMAALPAFGLDVSGVELGSNINDALKIVQQVNPKYKITPLGINNSMVGLAGFAPDQADWNRVGYTQYGTYGDSVDEITVMQSPLDHVWFISRLQRLSKDKTFPVKTLISSLIQKYGPPSGEYDPTGWSVGMAWTYDRNGRQHKIGRDQPEQACSRMVDSAYYKTPSPNGAYNSLLVPTASTQPCGQLIEATWSDDGGLVRAFMVRIFDVKKLNDYQVGVLKQREAEKQKELDDQLSKKLTPKL